MQYENKINIRSQIYTWLACYVVGIYGTQQAHIQLISCGSIIKVVDVPKHKYFIYSANL